MSAFRIIYIPFQCFLWYLLIHVHLTDFIYYETETGIFKVAEENFNKL